ncbi:PhaM family polyhydroxyalkanoate granule multifunctional regulatory protein [Burkholderia sp. LMU1-1-1.1]|uniref:PhaM family polyhydroxyalkanoate granule multifunctional regulatory protein n=1 Tax=Burkholderia sp. LMU1-1-1.1 TaxID=3135266 RepID=UPI00342D652F
MTDTLDFVKNLWGSMSVPGLTAPTLSVDELDKKINDLKAVEAWLNLNMSMLRGSIQALEVQRGTIATLKSVGASLAAAVNTGANDKSIFDANPYASAFFHHAREADKAPASTPSWPPAPSAAPAPAPAPAQQAAPQAPDAAPAPKPVPDAAAQMPNPAVWWNLLQDQFKQAVSTAMASESMMADAAARATDTAVKFAAAATAGGKPAGADAGANAGPGGAKAATADKPAVKPAPKKAPAKTAPAKTAKPGSEKS